MKAGAMRWPIKIQSPVFTLNTQTGENTLTGWTDVLSTRADVQTNARVSSKLQWETVVAQQIRPVTLVMFVIRFNPSVPILETYRVFFNNLAYEIKSITNTDTRNREMWIMCEQGLTQG